MSDEPENTQGFGTRFVEITRSFRARVQSGGLGKDLAGHLKNFEPRAAIEWAGRVFQRQSSFFYGKILTALLCSYFIADLTSIVVGKFIPAPPSSNAHTWQARPRNLDDYNILFARNLFSSTGTIPGEETGNPNLSDLGGTPVKTALPFNLIGTMIMRDEMRSIATIEDSSAQQVYPVREEDEIPAKAKIVKIEIRRVIFVNETNHQREFVEIPENMESSAPRISLGNKANGIEQTSPTQFAIARSEVDKAMSDLNNILTQARCIPNFENGQPAGYKCFQIVPGSIYQKLGILDGDVICGFDGQPANDPTAAFEKLSNIKNTSHLDLCIKRAGKQMTYSYDFK